jgi:hypothetical protein
MSTTFAALSTLTFTVSAVTLLRVRSTEPPPAVDAARPRTG